MPDIRSIFADYAVSHHLDDSRGGWVHCRCPHCGDHEQKLGFSITRRYFYCWRCGFHKTKETLAALLGVDDSIAGELTRSLLDDRPALRRRQDEEVQHKIKINPFKYPSGVCHLLPRHADYLTERGFDPVRLVADWGIRSLGPVAYLDDQDYKNRILIPIVWDGSPVSFQARDVTGRSPLRYKACPAHREAVPHKSILYMHEDAWAGRIGPRIGIAVEGVTDVWRLGKQAFALFGMQFKQAQVREIARRFDRVAIVFDPGKQAQRQAFKLFRDLESVGVSLTILDPPPSGRDPGSLDPDEVRAVLREVAAWSSAAPEPRVA